MPPEWRGARRLHIADATAQAIKTKGLRNPGLMATAFTMEQSFYTDRLIASGLSPIVPNESNRAETHRIIYEELCKDVTTAQSTAAYVAIANRLAALGADRLILRCTEVGMLLNQGNVVMPVFDTTLIHCNAVLDYALECMTAKGQSRRFAPLTAIPVWPDQRTTLNRPGWPVCARTQVATSFDHLIGTSQARASEI
jgi:hypothetical protein